MIQKSIEFALNQHVKKIDFNYNCKKNNNKSQNFKDKLIELKLKEMFKYKFNFKKKIKVF